jgi:putative ABC transport system ATP-binding protein
MSDHPVIHTVGLVKTYVSGTNEVHALRGVDLTIERGELVAIMGSSGSGKSTLMNLLGCLDSPTSGSFELDGVRIDGLGKNELAAIRNQKLGFVFQGFNLLPRTTAVENVELPLLYDRSGRKRDTKAMAVQALERVGLGGRLDHQPSELSGGQQQRVAVARALAQRPDLIFADEPTGNLDSRASSEILGFMQTAVRDLGQTVVMVTHEPTAAAYADRVLFLADGQIVDEMQSPTADAVLDRMKRFGD